MTYTVLAVGIYAFVAGFCVGTIIVATVAIRAIRGICHAGTADGD